MISTLRIGSLCVLACLFNFAAYASTPLTVGNTYAGSITVSGQTNAFTFTGTAGQHLFFDSLDADNLTLYATLLSPGGVTLYSNNDDSDGNKPWLLTESGAYTLVIGANANTPITGNFNFRILDISKAPTLTFGATFSDQLSPPLACNIYQFNATHGQRFSFQFVSYSTTQFQWQLISPANVVLAQGPWYIPPTTTILPIDGAYSLLVQGIGTGTPPTPLTYQLQASLASDAPVASSGFGTAHAGTISANATNSFTYTASAGLPIYFDSLDASGQSLVVDLFDPSGNAVFSIQENADAGPVILPRSGTYTLNVRGPGGASGNYNFRLLDLTAVPVLPLNTVVSNSLTLAYQTDIYQFTGSAGQRLYYDSQVSAQENVRVQLIGPDGGSPFYTPYFVDQGPLALPASGTYYLFVQNNSLTAGISYQFNMMDVAAKPTLPLNTDLTGTLPAYTSMIYQLNGTAGQKLYFNGKGTASGSAYWTLYDTRNSPVSGAGGVLWGDFQTTILYTGNYTLVLSDGAGSIDYSNQVASFSYSTNALTLGTTYTNNIFNPGDQVFYTFNGTAGQRIYYDAANPDTPSIYATLMAPTGVQLHSGNASYDFGTITLPQTGTYRLQFNGINDTTGSIAFSLLDVAAQPLVPLNQDFTGTLPANSSLLYRLNGTPGENLYFNAKGGSVGGSYWTLLDPWNNAAPYGFGNLGSDFEPTLYYSGEYVLVLAAGSNPAFYSNQVNTFTITTNAITFGTVVTNNLVNPGDQLYFKFNGTAGQRFYLDSLVPNYSLINFVMISPSGTQVTYGNITVDYSGGLIELLQTGTYLLQVSGSGDTIGPVSFQMLDIDSQPTLPLNTDLIGNLAPNVSLGYKLTGSVGQHLYFNAKGTSGNGVYWILYGPNNAQVYSAPLSSDFELNLPYAGTYALVLDNGSNPIAYTNQVNTFNYTTNALSTGSAIVSTLVNPGDQIYYTFTGTVGQRLYYDARQTNGVSISAMLVSPSGMTLFNNNAASDSPGPFTLTQTGTYTLVLSGYADTTGAVNFNLLDLAAATPVTLGTPINDALADQTQTRFYKFNGAAGQRINLQSLSASGNQAFWVLYSPSDQPVGPEPYINGNMGTVVLPVTGTYTLAVIGNTASPLPLSYQLSLTDVSDSSVAPTGFGTVHTGNVNANQTNLFSYNASAGTVVFFDSQDSSGQNLVVDLIAPDGTLVIFGASEVTDAGPYVLPRSGSYTLAVRGSNGASGNFGFRLLNLGASTQLSFNTPVTGSLNNPYQTDVYKFTTTPGQVVIYDALTNDFNFPSVYANILDPKGQSIGPSGSDFQSDRGPFVVQYGGTCYVFMLNSKATANAYSFQLIDVASQTTLPVNSSVTNNLSLYGQIVYRYSGTAGQQLYFTGNPNNPSGAWQLFDPNQTTISSAGLTGDMEVTLPYTGTYTLALYSYGASSGTEVFLVNDFNYLTNSYTVGSAVVDVIHRPGERRFYTFTGTLGQTLIYDALTNDPAGPGHIYATLYNPQGLQEGPVGGSFFSFDLGPFTLQQSGTYTLAFDGYGEQTGTYAFQLLDVSTQPVLPINASVTNTLNPYPLIVYRYSGTAGQQLYFHGDGNNLSGHWNLYDQNNNDVSYAGAASDFEVKLPTTGQYSLVLGSYSTAAGPEIFQVNDFSYFTNTYTLGTPVVDAIKRPGEQHFYTFTGIVGQRLVYNALTNDPVSPNFIIAGLLNPQGVNEGPINGRFSVNQGPFTLQQSGTYTLVMDGNYSSVGAFAFQLLDVSSQATLPISTSVSNILGVFPLEVYKYSGLPGQNLYFHGAGTVSGNWYLYDPNNTLVGGAGLWSDFQVTLQTPGTYVLTIVNFSTTPAPEIFQVNPFNAGEAPVVNQAPILTFIPDQVFPSDVLVTFTAKATDPNNNALTFSLDSGSPAGATINPTTGAFGWNPPVTGLSSVTPITVRVTDNGTPSLSAAQTLNIEVIAGPQLISAQPSNNVVNVSWHSAPGKHYRLLYKNEIIDSTWQAVGADVTATALITVQVDSGVGARTYRFYRIQALDPLTP